MLSVQLQSLAFALNFLELGDYWEYNRRIAELEIFKNISSDSVTYRQGKEGLEECRDFTP